MHAESPKMLFYQSESASALTFIVGKSLQWAIAGLDSRALLVEKKDELLLVFFLIDFLPIKTSPISSQVIS